MKKLNVWNTWIFPFIRVNTLLIVAWLLLLEVFRSSGILFNEGETLVINTSLPIIISGVICYLFIYLPHFAKLYRDYNRNNGFGLLIGSLCTGISMICLAYEEYIYAFIAYFLSIGSFTALLYQDLYRIAKCNKQMKEARALKISSYPKQEIPNSKIIIVEHIHAKEIQSILRSFCSMYNEITYKVIVKLSRQVDMTYVLTFPYDIDFEHFCYLVNYLVFPEPEPIEGCSVRGWFPLNPDQPNAMFYIPEHPQEGDNVYVVTHDHKTYKIDFSNLTPTPAKDSQTYHAEAITPDNLMNSGTIFK